MLISGGMSYIVPDVLEQLASFNLDVAKIDRHLILHSHFDHVGVVPFFKRRWPHLEVLASGRAWEILAMPKAKNTINEFSKIVSQRMRPAWEDSGECNWDDDITGTAVHDGTVIDLGGQEALVLATPGHSSCSVSLYVPALKALLPSDAGGIPYQETIFPTGNSNFTQFQESLVRLSRLEVDYLGADHYGYISGEEARTFIADTAEVAARLRALIENIYARKRDVDATVKYLIAEHYRRNPDYFLAPEILTGVYRQMVRHISGSASERVAVTAHQQTHG
jgi:glyoxylase-like metal-dependent hydrolase (beta-lactamase superfamily II)